jgi:sucrose-phosphate synthase
VLGGAPFNVAWHLRGFGADPLLITAIGSDVRGVEIRRRMREWGLATDGVQVDRRHPTGRVDIRMSDGEHGFEIGEGQAWDHIGTRAARRVLAGSERLIYHGTLALRSERSRRTLQRIARGGGAPPTFVDLNLRDPWSTPERIRWSAANARWLKLNGRELATVTGRSTRSFSACRDSALALAKQHSIPRVIVTRGGSDALCVVDGESVYRSSPPHVDQVVDTVGAGDAFSAVALVGVLADWSVQASLDRAVRFAADVCRIRGATTTDTSLYERHLHEWATAGEPAERTDRPGGLYIMSLSVHGLVRSEAPELGRDADTGGQVSYVIDEARALAAHPEVEHVDLITREIRDRNVDNTYARPFEPISDNAQIVRLPFGPRRYLRKESLWPHLDTLLDQITRYVRNVGRIPDVVHGHYADAGYVGAQLANVLGVPFVFTGHSLGRVKRERLLESGRSADKIEESYRLSTRIEAEERALETAAFVVASTTHEVRDQYERYDRYEPELIRVIPPGVDLSRFSPPDDDWPDPPILEELSRFLDDPTRPMILALARPDERKNFEGLIRAFGGTQWLRARANLVVVAGNRDDLQEMDPGPRRVLQHILLLVDRYDLYGIAAYPKTHDSADVPDLYRLAARTHGVFVNPALTEPFGLTLIEAAASGLPVVSTDDGGPQDIVAKCGNGLLVDAMDPSDISRGLKRALSSRSRWNRWSRSGLAAAHELFSWESHAAAYVAEVQRAFGGMRPGAWAPGRSRLPLIDRVLVTDVDHTLTGDLEGLRELRSRLVGAGDRVAFGIATGRSLERALAITEELEIPAPDVLITGSGTQLHYGKELTRDRSWERQIRHRWDPAAVAEALDGLPGLELGPKSSQSELRLTYTLDPERAPDVREIRRHLRRAGVRATTIVDRDVALDVVPVRASPGLAIRFLAFKWDLEPERLLVAGDSGNDEDMLSGRTLGVVVGNHSPELEKLRGMPRVYFAEASHARGILEGIDWYDFFGDIRPGGADAA